MEEQEQLDFRCPYCGTADKLPENELDRALELKGRVASAKRSAVQLERTQAALAHIFEDRWAFVRVQGTWLVLLVIVIAYALFGSWEHIANAPEEFRLGLILNALSGPMFIGGIAIAFAIALLIGRAGYRRQVRPGLRARPPRQEGEPARCRTCGALLPDERGPLIRCSYCDTHNLVTADLQKNRASLLREEESAYRKKASGAVASTARSSIHMTRIIVISVVVVYLLQFGLLYLASASFPGS